MAVNGRRHSLPESKKPFLSDDSEASGEHSSLLESLGFTFIKPIEGCFSLDLKSGFDQVEWVGD